MLHTLIALSLIACTPEKVSETTEEGLRGANTDDTATYDTGGPGGPGDDGGDGGGPGGDGPGGDGGDDGGTDGTTDTACADTTDRDGDGFTVCDDCDDNDPEEYPNQLWFYDGDGDGYGDPETPLVQCEREPNHVTFGEDCDDTDPEEFPGQLWYPDADGDGFGGGIPAKTCERPPGSLLDSADCDDLDPLVNPDAEEICNGLDDDCDGSIPIDEQDLDADGFSICEGDTDDSDPSIVPLSEWLIGGTSSSWTASYYFRGNTYTAAEDALLDDFSVYLGLSSDCDLDFYVHGDSGGSWSQLWSGTVAALAGEGHYSSPTISLPIIAGNTYGLGVAWNCSATYYGSDAGWSGTDAGVGLYDQNYYDNYYSSYSTSYTANGFGTSSLAYDQIIHVAR